MVARPRPRPRPVAKTRVSAADATTTTTTTTTAATTNNKTDDEDALFMRSRGRTDQQWMQLQQLARTNSTTHVVLLDSSEDDDHSQEDASPPPRLIKRQKQTKQNIPRWQTLGVGKLLSSEEEDDDDDIVLLGGTDNPVNSTPRKRKRERSRSRSITPPPELPAHLLNNTRNLVRQALAVPQRAPSPTFLPDDSTDTIVLDPELAKIAEAVKKQTVQRKVEGEQAGGPEVVQVNVKWIPHPLNDSAQKHIWMFKTKRHNTFHDLFEELADLASIMVSQLVVTYEAKRVFSSGSPSSLGIWTEGELEAYDKHTYEYIRTRRHQRPVSPTLSADESDDDEPHDTEMQSSDEESEAESTSDDKFKLVLRSATTKDITLTVRSTTTCSAIVKAFLKAADLPDVYSDVQSKGKGKQSKPYPRLKIDGEKQAPDAEIGNADLDDGDLVEVVGI